MAQMKLIEDLKWRGLVHQCTDIEGLEKLLDSESITLYCGFDPTADSLHVGHLIPMISLMRFKQHGHNPLALIGGATGFIGDPSGKSQERVALMEEVVLQNSRDIGKQLATITKVNTVNNLDWTKNMSVIDFMRNLGKHFSIGAMLARDSVSSRLNGDGISFTEFSYMLFQANDFLQLAKDRNCKLQIGGSDQFGNMCSGLDLLRRNQKEGFALTFPLLTKSDGSKFGKSEKGAVWLDAQKTSPWEFFQFWLNTADADVVKLLKLYTFLPHETIVDLEEKTKNSPELRAAQKALAVEMTTLIHGAEVCQSVQEVAELLFSGKKFELSDTGIDILKSIIPVAAKDVTNIQEVKQVLVETQLLTSMTKATQAIKDNSVTILELGGEPLKVTEDMKEFTVMKPFLIKKGKKHFALVV
jgi:tyrosyl-tRNA synthetase